MRTIGPDPGASRAAELQRLIAAQGSGADLLVLRDGDARQRIVVLDSRDEHLAIGRDAECDVVLAWDVRVSRVHVELTRAGGAWLVSDDGLSRNGTFVNGERLGGRRRLEDGDRVVLGATAIEYRTGRHVAAAATASAGTGVPGADSITPAQRRVLVALCRPLRDGAIPATNRAIADELVLSVPAVKTHLRALWAAFGISELPQNAKRAQLAELALRSGVVLEREL